MTKGRKTTQLQRCFMYLALVSAAMGFLVSQAQAATFTYPDFSSTAGLTLVGSAAQDGNVLRITPANFGQSGAAYSTTAITLGTNDTFSTTFQFRFTNTGGIDPADGITFVLAPNTTGLGVGGGDLGYGGVPNTVAIEFDTFENGGVDSSSNHVAIDTNGNLNNLGLTNVYGVSNCVTGTNLAFGCLSNGDVWTAKIGYDGTNISVQVQDGNAAPFTVFSNLNFQGAAGATIAQILGQNTAFVGFTGGTGSGFENQDILNWSFSDTTSLSPTSAPEPTSLALLGAGLGFLALVRRRKTQA